MGKSDIQGGRQTQRHKGTERNTDTEKLRETHREGRDVETLARTRGERSAGGDRLRD